MSGTMLSHSSYPEAPLDCLAIDVILTVESTVGPEAVPDIRDHPLYAGFILGFTTPGWINDHPVMMSQLRVSWIKLGIIQVRLQDPSL